MHIPRDTLKDVFTPKVITAWRGCQKSSDLLKFRLNVLEACGPYPHDQIKADRLRSFRAQKAAWEAYLDAAFACGMFEGDKGKDIRARLTRTGDDGFRSAMAECEACWFLAGRMGFKVDPDAPGRKGKNLEMRIFSDQGDTGIEVKAPFRARPEPHPGESAVARCGGDSDKISECIKTASKQFNDDCPNILVIIPNLRNTLFGHRRDLLKAAYGESKLTFQVNRETGEGRPMEVKFFPEGKFLNTKRPGGRLIKHDGFPAHRRVSVILCIEERIEERYPMPDPFALLPEETLSQIWPLWEKARKLHFSPDNRKWVEHNVLVLHNPYAYHQLPEKMWDEFPQFLSVNGEMMWTDGYKIDA